MGFLHAIAHGNDLGTTRTADRVSAKPDGHLRLWRCRGWREDGRTDPGAIAPRQPGRELHGGVLPTYDAPDHQSRGIMGRKPELLSAAWRHPAPRRARMALVTRRHDQVFASAV